MLYQEDFIRITELLSSVLSKTKKGEHFKFSDEYAKRLDLMERVSIHSEIGKFPESLFIKRAPNQTQEEFDYIKANHKTISYTVWSKFLGARNVIWSDQNWSIDWDSEKELQEYHETEIPIYGSIEQFFKTLLPTIKSKDANGVLCCTPYKVPLKRDAQGNVVVSDNGSVTIDQSKSIDPYPVFYNSDNVIEYVRGDYAVLMTAEKSEVKYNNALRKEGYVFEIYDTNFIYKLTQIGDKVDYKFSLSTFYKHDLGYLPVWDFKGVPLQFENRLMWMPHFMAAVDTLDLMLLDNSYLIAQKAAHAFQQKWEYSDPCDYSNDQGSCVNGKIYNGDKEVECPSCHGSGRKRPSILGVYQVKSPDMNMPNVDGVKIPPFGWAAPDPTILEFLRKEIDGYESKALNILNIEASSDSVKGSDTALGKMIDMQERFSMLLSISNQDFDLFENYTVASCQMRAGLNVKTPIISYPKNFQIRTEENITSEIATAKDAGLPDVIIRALTLEYIMIRFNTEERVSKVTAIAFAADKLITLSSNEITAQSISKTIAPWQIVLHTNIFNYIDYFSRTSLNWISKKIDEQIKDLEEKAKEDFASIPVAKILDINSMV